VCSALTFAYDFLLKVCHAFINQAAKYNVQQKILVFIFVACQHPKILQHIFHFAVAVFFFYFLFMTPEVENFV